MGKLDYKFIFVRIEELKTNDPSRHSQLNLLLPEQNKSKDEDEGYGTKITLKKEDGTIYSSILFGMVDRSVGGISGGQLLDFQMKIRHTF